MHIQIRRWIGCVAAQFPEYFHDKKVLDVGSLDVNGTNRGHFVRCEYTGIDIGPGLGVDYVSKCHEFKVFSDGYFDVVISTDMLEHDQYWAKSITRMVELLKPGGLWLWTCAGRWRFEHGTTLRFPESSPYTVQTPGWESYYRNLVPEDIRTTLDLDKLFCDYELRELPTENWGIDLQFWGIKR
jgi:SAM-dependent methyltransferase